MPSSQDAPSARRRTPGSAPAVVLACAVMALALWPGTVSAQAGAHVGPQPGSFGFHGGAGVAVPAGELADVVDAGATLGAGVSYFLNRHLGLWGGADVQFLSGATDRAGSPFPDMRAFHAGVGGELNLAGGYDLRDASDPTPVTATFRAGIGVARLDTEDTLDSGAAAPVAYEHTHLSFRGGATAGYQFAPRVNAYVGSTVHLILTDLEDTRALADHSTDVDVFDTAWVIPVHLGVRVTLR